MSTPSVKDLLTRDEGLATRLRRAREPMLAKELASRAGWPQSKVSKIEAGRQLPSHDDLDVWASITDAPANALGQWHAMLTEAQQARRDWARLVREGQAGVQNEYNRIITNCTQYQFLETTFIPRFFQVPGYTRAVLAESHERLGGTQDIEEAVAARQASTGLLYDTNRTFQLLVTEPVLRWRPRALAPTIMRQQLDRLLNVDGLQNVQFGVLPLDQPVRYFPQNAVELYGDVGFVEEWFTERRLLADEVEQYRGLMDELWQDALTGEHARQLILKVLSNYPH